MKTQEFLERKESEKRITFLQKRVPCLSRASIRLKNFMIFMLFMLIIKGTLSLEFSNLL